MSMLAVIQKKEPIRLSFRVFIAVAAVVMLAAGCEGKDDELIDDLLTLEISDYQGRDVSEMTVEELERAIEVFRKEIESKVRAAELAGAYHKILGIRYLNMGMYRLAYDQFKAGLEIYPSNYILTYYVAVCAARTAKSLIGDPTQDAYYADAEQYYLTAIEYSPNYTDALYGLSILYVFELDRPSDATEYLERILAKESKNFDAMFVLARVYAEGSRADEALRLYKQIALETGDVRRRAAAEKNVKELGGSLQ